MSRTSWYRRVLPSALAVIVSVPAWAAGQGIQPHVPVSTTLGDIARMRSAYVEAFNARNAAAVNAMYAADAIVLGADGSETTGAAIARRNLDSVSTWSPAVVRSTSVKVFGATAIDVGTWTIRTPAGVEVVSRYLAVLRRDVKGWKLQNVAVVPVTR